MRDIQDLFDFPKLKIIKKIRLIELFGGIGSQAMALRDIGADFEHYKLVEFDKYAVQSYNAIHDTRHTTHDIRQIHASDLEIKDTDKYTYIMTYSFPCTDLSVAGKMEGMKKGSGTRSGLLWEVERILKECSELPQVLLMENVTQVHGEQNKEDFENWLSFLRGKGYHNFYKDLNAKDYGIPQNRDRCFCISILSDDFIEYNFPEPKELTTVMKDFLEPEVDEKYYINNEKSKKLINQLLENRVITENREAVLLSKQGTVFEGETDIATCLMARDYKGLGNQTGNGVIEKVEIIPMVVDKNDENKNFCKSADAKLFINDEPIARTLTCKCGGGQEVHHNNMICVAMRGRGMDNKQQLEPNFNGTVNTLTTVQKDNLVLEKEYVNINQATKEGYIKCKVGGCFDSSYPESKTRRGRVQNNGDITPTLTASSSENINYVETQYRIRKLTPRECWRLMGYTDEDFDKAQSSGVSNSQLYKQAGNAIVKQVLMAIFSQML